MNKRNWRLLSDHINSLQDASIEKLVQVCKQAHYVNVSVRINGEDRLYQADWIKWLSAAPVSGPSEDDGDWQCRDFADGWITFPDRKAAERYQEQTGAMMRYRKFYQVGRKP